MPIHTMQPRISSPPPKMATSSSLFLATIYNQSQLAERKHVARYWLINTVATAVQLSAHPSPLVITMKLAVAIFGGDCTEEVFCRPSTTLVICTPNFQKRTAAILEFYLQFWPIYRHRLTVPNFVQLQSNQAELWRHIDLSTRRLWHHNSQSYIRLQVWRLHSCEKVKIYPHAKFWWVISIHGSVITTCGLGKQTAAIL